MAEAGAHTELVLTELTTAFDTLMAAAKEFLESEYNAGRIREKDFSQVYLGAMESVMATSLTWSLSKDKADSEIRVADAQKCKLDAEFDVLVLQKAKVTAETGLLDQRKVSESAQTTAGVAATGSLMGKQITLYGNQADGFLRDAEQKGTKIMADTWNVRRTTDESTVADTTNKFDDATIGAFVTKLKDGINA